MRHFGRSALLDGARPWYGRNEWADFCAVADFNNDRYALPALGPELVVNGDFSNGTTGWSAIGGASISVTGGVMRVTSPGGQAWPVASQSIGGLQAGKRYRGIVTRRMVSGTYGAVTPVQYPAGTNIGGTSIVYTGAAFATEEFFFTARGPTIDVLLGFGASTPTNGWVVEFDDVSIREVLLTRGAEDLGPNLAAFGYTMSVNGGAGTATESPSGQLNLTGDGTSAATANKAISGLTVGKRYRFSYNSSTTSYAFAVGTSSGGTQTVPVIATSGFVSGEFTATATTHHLTFARTGVGTTTITAIELRELPSTGAYKKRAATFAEWFAYTASSDYARTYTDAAGVTRSIAEGNTNYCRTYYGSPEGSGGNGWTAIDQSHSLAPDGLSNWTRWTWTTNGNCYVTLVPTMTNLTYVDYVSSLYVKAHAGATLGKIWLWIGKYDATQRAGVRFNGDGTVTMLTLGSDRLASEVGVDDMGGGVYRIWVTARFSAVYSTAFQTWISAEATNGDVLTWGQQFEMGTRPTELKKTTGTALTAANKPRFDWFNGKPQLRLEDARTRMLGELSAAGSANGGSATILPAEGVFNPVRVTSAGADWHRRRVTGLSVTNNRRYVWRIRYRAGTSPNITLTVGVGGVQTIAAGALGNLSTSGIAGTVTIQEQYRLPNGDYEAFGSWVPNATGSDGEIGVGPYSATSGQYVDVIALQLELVLGNAGNTLGDASSWIPGQATSVTRAIESCRYSALMEAVVQGASGTIHVRAQKIRPDGTGFGRLVGGSSSNSLLGVVSGNQSLQSWNGSASVTNNLPAGLTTYANAFTGSVTWDSSGRSVCGNPSSVATDTGAIGNRAGVWLARGDVVDLNQAFGAGWYDLLAISPERLPDARLQQLEYFG